MGIFDLMNKTDTRYTMQREDGRTVYNPPGQHMKILKDRELTLYKCQKYLMLLWMILDFRSLPLDA